MPKQKEWFVGENIRREREFLGVSQSALARRLCWNVTHLCKMEKGTRGLNTDQVKLVALVLGISSDRLCGLMPSAAA